MIWGLSLTTAIWWGQNNFPFQLFWEMFRDMAGAPLQSHLPGISKIFRFAVGEMLRSASYGGWIISEVVHIQNQWENMVTLVLLLEKSIVKYLVSRHFLRLTCTITNGAVRLGNGKCLEISKLGSENYLRQQSWNTFWAWPLLSQPSVVTCELAFSSECEVSSLSREQNCLWRMWHKWGGSRPCLATFTLMV